MFKLNKLLCGFIPMIAASSCAYAESLANMPEPVSNNAVTLVTTKNNKYILSFSGLGNKKDHTDVHNKTFVYNINEDKWSRATDVPIVTPVIDKSDNDKRLTGRLASVATSVGELAYVFGGYTVAKNHEEVSVPDVYSYDVLTDKFTLLSPMPVPVDDSVALPYQERYVYLVSGWHNDGNVNLVQLYDIKTNTWSQASPFPGRPVFGQAGAILNNSMLICDGVKTVFSAQKRRTYAPEPACYKGTIAAENPNKIDWRIIPHPTGTARYRMAAIGDKNTQKMLFVGGSDNPYNYSGIGYNTVPSEPDGNMWSFDPVTNEWAIIKSKHQTMDHRSLIILNDKFLTIGGMGTNQKVLNSIIKHN